MTDSSDPKARSLLRRIARRAMLERGLLPDFSAGAMAELARIGGPSTASDGSRRDLRGLLWCSIDNDDSEDLDQLTVAIPVKGAPVRILVAVADVDALVVKGSALDDHARHNTTSVYTAAEIFPMIPEKLSTDLTSLRFDADRTALIVDMTITEEGNLEAADVYQGLVHNRAKLAYNSVAAWLEGDGPAPEALLRIDGLPENLKIQDRLAQALKTRRHSHGALDLETLETRAVFDQDDLRDLEVEQTNRAKDIIEDFMIAANGVTARFLEDRHLPSFRRVVRTPKRWDRIVELARDHHFTLPSQPDPKALDRFLLAAKAADPIRFPDLSLSVVKLLGSGEYVAELPGEEAGGHFGLAVKDYTHSTAPNRRFPDLLTQRLLKAAAAGRSSPYANDELEELAAHCTEAEDEAKKVERQVEKSAAAMLLQSRIGEQFDGIVTGASQKGTWVRLFKPPVEGRVVSGEEGLDVGKRVRVVLVRTDVERGFIDFKRV